MKTIKKAVVKALVIAAIFSVVTGMEMDRSMAGEEVSIEASYESGDDAGSNDDSMSNDSVSDSSDSETSDTAESTDDADTNDASTNDAEADAADSADAVETSDTAETTEATEAAETAEVSEISYDGADTESDNDGSTFETSDKIVDNVDVETYAPETEPEVSHEEAQGPQVEGSQDYFVDVPVYGSTECDVTVDVEEEEVPVDVVITMEEVEPEALNATQNSRVVIEDEVELEDELFFETTDKIVDHVDVETYEPEEEPEVKVEVTTPEPEKEPEPEDQPHVVIPTKVEITVVNEPEEKPEEKQEKKPEYHHHDSSDHDSPAPTPKAEVITFNESELEAPEVDVPVFENTEVALEVIDAPVYTSTKTALPKTGDKSSPLMGLLFVTSAILLVALGRTTIKAETDETTEMAKATEENFIQTAWADCLSNIKKNWKACAVTTAVFTFILARDVWCMNHFYISHFPATETRNLLLSNLIWVGEQVLNVYFSILKGMYSFVASVCPF